MEISNKTLAWLVIAAIVVSIFGTTLSVMNMSDRGTAGYATSNTTGEAKVEVSQAVVLRFVSGENSTDFGSGTINTSGGFTSCNMMVNNTAGTGTYYGCSGFAATPGAMILENVGTSYLNVTLNFSKNDTDFLPVIPGSGRGGIYFKYTVWNGTNGGCTPGTQNATVWGVWTDVGIPNTTVNVCGNLSWAAPANKLLIGMNISVNGNITAVPQTVTIRAQGTSI